MGRVLGVDLGDVRIGLALSDPDGIVATPLETLAVRRPGEAGTVADEIAAVARERDATAVVIGLPRNLRGREGRPAQFARAVAGRLEEAADLEVHLWDERFTTVEAERTMLEQGVRRRPRRAAVDRVAATLILQAFLERRRRTRGDRA